MTGLRPDGRGRPMAEGSGLRPTVRQPFYSRAWCMPASSRTRLKAAKAAYPSPPVCLSRSTADLAHRGRGASAECSSPSPGEQQSRAEAAKAAPRAAVAATISSSGPQISAQAKPTAAGSAGRIPQCGLKKALSRPKTIQPTELTHAATTKPAEQDTTHTAIQAATAQPTAARPRILSSSGEPKKSLIRKSRVKERPT